MISLRYVYIIKYVIVTKYEVKKMKKNASKRFLAWIIAVLMVVTYMPSMAYATNTVSADDGAVTEEDAAAVPKAQAEEPESTGNAVEGNLTDIPLLDGKLLVHNELGTGSLSQDGVITVTAPGKPLGSLSANTVTVYNKSTQSAIVSFDYKATNYSAFNKTNAEGSFNEVIEAGGYEVFSITGKKAANDNTAVLTFSNFSFTEVADESQLTFKYDSKLGNITVAGEKVESGYSIAATYGEGIALNAQAADGADFLGWINAETGRVYSREASYTLKPTQSAGVEAVFVGADSKGYYLAGNKYLMDDFAEAASKASRLSEQTMVLMNDTTLVKGTYTVPAGVTLLIPFDDENTLYTTKPGATHGEYKSPVAYRTLTLADGATLIVNGALSLSAKQNAAQGSAGASGAPTGDVSFIDMAKGSSITVNNGAALYAYGYIIGDGNVTAKDGATVYENFQIEDFRGGTVTTNMVEAVNESGEKYSVLPISQYYVQNIEVPLTLEAGAVEKTYATVYMSSNIFGTSIDFIGQDSAMFNLTEGSVIKKYDGSKDRLVVQASGNMSLSSIEVSVSDQKVDSSSFNLPLNSNITVEIKNGKVNIDQDLSLLPGSEIIIDEGAKCTLKNGAVVYVYGAEQWGNYCVTGKSFSPVSYAPGRTYTRTEKDLVDAKVLVNGTLDASGGLLYTTTNEDYDKGGNICSTKNGVVKVITGYDDYTYQYLQTTDEYVAINLLPANLLNKDGSYVQTMDEKAGIYTYGNGNWMCSHKVAGESVIKDATCTEDGVKKVTCELGDYAHTYDVIIPATGHDEEKVAAKDATCTSDGNDAYWVCDTCGKMYSDEKLTNEIKEIPVKDKLGHDIVKHDAKSPSCGQIGWDAYETCSRCDYSTYEGKEKTALKHAATPVVEVPASCTKDGVEAHYICLNCGGMFADEACTEKLDEKPVIPAGHKWKSTEGKEPTCTESVAGAVCEVCHVEKDIVEALGHDFADATCEAPKTCKREGCGVTEGEALGHDWKDPTCTEPKTCKTCGDTEGEALGHDEIPHAAKAASCTEAGWEAYITCGREGCDYSTYKEIEATKHDIIKVDAKKPSCTESGNEKHWKCTKCGILFKDSAGDEVISEADVTLSKLNHTPVIDEAVEATCEEKGLTEGSHCSVCQGIIVAQKDIDPIGHDWDEGKVTTKPTTEKDGVRTFTCKNDKTHTKIDKIEKLTENQVTTYDEFIKNLVVLEELADDYIKENPGKDPLNLIIKYIRTGVNRYNSGSWKIMAGEEDSDFAAYVADREYEYNLAIETAGEGEELADKEKMTVTGLKNIEELTLPNGDYVDLGHMFGTMDLTYHNNFRVDNADVGGWSGDIVDLLSLTDFAGTGKAKNVNEMASYIKKNYLGKDRVVLNEAGFVPNAEEDDDDNVVPSHYNEGVFSSTDMMGDLDAYYIMNQLKGSEYEAGDITAIAKSYFTKDLTMKQRAAYLIQNRLNGETLRTDLRKEVYKAYTGNSAISTLEGTREWKNSKADLEVLREAACYAFADYICELAGDYFENLENDYFTISSSERTTLAPGVTQTVVKAVSSKDNMNMAYYIATADVTRDDVTVCANYATRPVEKDSKGNYKWDMTRVIDQAQNVQNKYGNPESKDYIANYNVVAAVNGDGFNMETGEPSGVLLMDGIEYHPCNNSGFFGMLADGSAVIGSKADYEKLKKEGKLKEAIGNFGATLVDNGKIAVTVSSDYFNDRQPRTAVGITKTGKVVMMVMDGREGGGNIESSCGGSAIEVAQVMLDAGCEEAIMLDGGGSSTYVAKEEGSTELSIVSKPSDGSVSRSVSTSLYVVSTAPSSTEFDHAVIDSEYSYITSGTTMQMNATAVSATNNIVDMPAGAKWTVSDTSKASITKDGKFTAKINGAVDVNLMLDDKIIGTKTINIVIPDNLYFTRKSVNMVYGESIELPIKAVYRNKPVAINPNDVKFKLSEAEAGEFDGFKFTAASTELKNIRITATIPSSLLVSVDLTVYLYNEDQARFDFDNASGGDSQLSWNREVTNSVTADNKTYTAIDRDADMDTEYTFAIDMSEIEVPEQLAGLTYMLPGSDKADASAWTFLCDLAERMSQQTEVCAEIKFDKAVEIDESCLKDITLVNDYFTLSSADFDKDTNTLTVKLNWIKQSKAIDIEMANPLCILGGIKIIPKDGIEWTGDKLNIVNSGNISYTVYMRANALYSFSQKPENQETYGLYPYQEERDGKIESGGYFSSVYNTFEDSYTLDKSVKNGWVMGDGGFKYYENDTLFTGIHKIDGYYYKFDEKTGINEGKTKYTGEYTDTKGNEYYIKNGEVNTGTDGWIMMKDGEFRYYNPKTGKREKVTKKETKSTCIIDGYCDWISASGAKYNQKYDDASGHEYKNVSGKQVCSVCGWTQYKMADCNVRLSRADWTYTGEAINPLAYATNPKTKKDLKRTNPYRDYYVNYYNNVEVGVGKAVVTASKYGIYQDLRQWRGNYSDSTEVYFTIHPEAPTNVTYYVKSKNVAKITWTKSKTADQYVVQYSTNSGKSWSNAKTLTGNSYEYKMNKKKSYMFRVIAKGKGLDKNGNTATYTALSYPVAKIKTVSNLKVKNTSSTGKPRVTWSGVNEANKYYVYRSTTGKSGSYSKVATTTKKYYNDTKASAGKTYYYIIKSVYSKNTKLNSDNSKVVKTVCDLAKPSLTLKTKGKGKIKVSWKKVSGSSSYKVYRKVSGGKWALVKTTSKTSFTDTKLKKGKTYYYRAIAVKKGNSEANSAYSSTKKKKCK